MRQTKKRAKSNSLMKARIDRARKELKHLARTQNGANIHEQLKRFASLVDKAEQKGVIKRNVASRIKSRLSRALRPAVRSSASL